MPDARRGVGPAVSKVQWADERTAASLQMIIEATHEVVGCRSFAIDIVRDDQLVRIAAAGSERAPRSDGTPTDSAETVGTSQPLAPVEARLEEARVVGRWRHELPEAGDVIPPAPRGCRRDPAYDTLLAPIHDAHGRLRAVLSAAGPIDHCLPDEAALAALDRYADRASRVVLAALEHEERAEHVRLLKAAHLLISSVAATDSFRDAFEQAAPTLMCAFRLTGMRLAAFEPEQVLWHGVTPDPAGHEDYDAHLHLRRRAADGLWAEQLISVVGLNQDVNQQYTSAQRVAEIKEMLRHHGLDSVLLVPLGAGDRAIGALWLYRQTGHWTEHEQRVLVDIGRDLGRLFVNAQALHAEQRLALRMQELESYKRTLISTLTHELKTPLTGILGNAEFLADADSLDDIRQSARAITRGASRMSVLVDELLLIARLDEPDRPDATRPVPLAAVAREAMDLHRLVSERAGVVLELSGDDGAVVQGSREDLMVMITNLVGNAVKYNNPGGRVEVLIERRGDQAAIEVADTGIGMDPADLERLFREFQRGTDAATLARPGSGLGLAIVDRIVRNHQGTVAVESAPGQGSTFRVLLPAVTPA